MSVSTPQIAAQLDRVLSSEPTALTVAIRAATRESWPDSLTPRGRRFALRWCESSLAIREALCDVEQKDQNTEGLVIITPLSTFDIAADIAARLARARVYQPEGWDMVRQLFQAKETDARLGRYPWMPQVLIDGAASDPYVPVANGFLGLDAAWREVLERSLGIATARPDAVTLLTWSNQPHLTRQLDRLPTAVRTDVLRWIADSSGVAGELIVGCIESGRTGDALPLGLVCGVVFAAQADGQPALGAAAIRLERFVNDKHITATQARAWADAAEQVVRSAGAAAPRAVLDRADMLLRELRIDEFAHLSDMLPASLDQRLRDFAQSLAAHAAAPTLSSLALVEAHADRALRHTMMSSRPPRAERIEMARRLARWLVTPRRPLTSLAIGATWFADEGAFVDWARFRLLGGDDLPELSQAYADCRAALTARRNPTALEFAKAVVDWNSHRPARDGRVVPVESVLEQVVAPIAATHPVLVLVMDGLSASIFRELFHHSEDHGWMELVNSDVGQPLVGVAALPTITEVSRTSLLCGRLMLGAAAQERAGFSAHPALLAHSRKDAPPRLFHKGDLADATNLAPEVRTALADPQQRVVGVVYNAIDDHLSGPDQLHQRWALEELRLLLPLFREAREARRVIVVTADHGHLLEDGSAAAAGADSDRWRPGTDARIAQELAVKGGRVVTRDGSNAVVCLWSESARFGGRKNGYHGGISPQEVIVPLSAFAPIGVNVPGWSPAPPAQPEWWELAPATKIAEAAPPVSVAARTPSRKHTAPAGQSRLFDDQNSAPAETPTADWIAALLSCAVYASQKQLAARVAIEDEKMRLLLSALMERGGKLSRTALAQRLSMPEMRLAGFLSATRRMLNVDQAPVLVVDDGAGTVQINATLLAQQFRIGTIGVQR